RHIGKRAAKVDPKAKSVTLQDGQSLKFDNLLIATGSSATIPPIPGTNLPGVHPLWTLGHTNAVLQATAAMKQPELVFAGAGVIGFIVMNAMYKRGWKLHVVEIADQVLPRMLDRDSARIVEAWLKSRGVSLHLGATVQSIADASGRKQVSLSNGQTLAGDL